jgi:hypothetical protein
MNFTRSSREPFMCYIHLTYFVIREPKCSAPLMKERRGRVVSIPTAYPTDYELNVGPDTDCPEILRCLSQFL